MNTSVCGILGGKLVRILMDPLLQPELLVGGSIILESERSGIISHRHIFMVTLSRHFCRAIINYHLPQHLQYCFAYCSIFPKNWKFERKELIRMWIAQGCVQMEKGSRYRTFQTTVGKIILSHP